MKKSKYKFKMNHPLNDATDTDKYTVKIKDNERAGGKYNKVFKAYDKIPGSDTLYNDVTMEDNGNGVEVFCDGKSLELDYAAINQLYCITHAYMVEGDYYNMSMKKAKEKKNTTGR